jgi:hypothetical protein
MRTPGVVEANPARTAVFLSRAAQAWLRRTLLVIP